MWIGSPLSSSKKRAVCWMRRGGEGLVSSQNGAFICLVFMTWYMNVIKLSNGVLFFHHLSLHSEGLSLKHQR